MTNRTPLAVLTALALAASAHAATIPLRLPSALPAVPLALPAAGALMPSVILPTLPTLPSGPTVLPSLHAPVSGPTLFPGVKNPLPLPEIKHAKADDGEHVLDWSFLDGRDDGVAGVLVPAGGGPKPIPPAGARAPLEFLRRTVESAPAGGEFFDHSPRRGVLLVARP